jgi:hypothetical protein
MMLMAMICLPKIWEAMHGDDEISQDHHNFISPFFFIYLNVTINGKKVRGKCKRRNFNQQPTFESSFSSTILFFCFLFFCFFFWG